MSVARDPEPPRFALASASPRGFAQVFVHEPAAPARRRSAATPLLLIHGAGRTHRLWWPTLRRLCDAGYEVIAPDLRGCGDSAPLPPVQATWCGDGASRSSVGYEIADHAADLTALVRDALGHARLLLVAHAEGAVIAQALALRQPGLVARMLLADAPLAAPREPAAGGPPVPEPAARGSARDLAGPALRCEALVLAGRLNPTPTRLLWSDATPGDPAGREARARRRFPVLEGVRHVAGVTLLPWEAPQAVIGALPPRDPETPPGAERAFVSLGSNLGDREALLVGAVAALRATPGVYDVLVSPVYETDPVGPGPQGPYLNAVAQLDTTLDARALLALLQQIERVAGRVRGTERNAPRRLDLDLLFFGELRVETRQLELPHPRLHDRPFVLEPLCDLAPQWRHPLLDETIEVLARRVRDPAAVRRRR